LDVELGGARLDTSTSAGLTTLARTLREALGPDKVITFTGMSVGADPPTAPTVPGSAHTGEVRDLLQMIFMYIDWVNVMAYDAGEEFARVGY
jgi:hypothetical protein